MRLYTEDGTRYEMDEKGTLKRDPPKPYRTKAERKVWKRLRIKARIEEGKHGLRKPA
jgi:hypothetical protein